MLVSSYLLNTVSDTNLELANSWANVLVKDNELCLVKK